MNPWRRIVRKITGFAILIAGLIISIPVIVPGWGLPVILVGLGILAPEYEWAGKLNRKAKVLYERLLSRMKERRRRRANGGRRNLLLVLILVLGLPAAADLSESRRTAIVTAVEKVLPATVTIGAKRVAVQQVNPFRSRYNDFFSDWFSDPFFGGFRRVVRVSVLGSGIIVNPAGLVLTNDHVVADAEDIQVTLSDGRIFPAKRIGRGLPLDLALMQIEQPSAPEDLPYVTLGTAEDLALGEWAIAIGAPSNLEASVTAGVISAVGRQLPAKQDYRYLGMIQTDAAINPGNSGGPLVNADGRVVGINTVIMSQSGGSEGLGFAIPADQALKVIDDLKTAGTLRLAWFGWELEENKKEESLVVRVVHRPSPAADIGIRPGVFLKEFNGKS